MCIRNVFHCLNLSAATMLIFICQTVSSSPFIAAARKTEKWNHFVRLHHGKPVSDQQKRNNEMLLIISLCSTS